MSADLNGRRGPSLVNRRLSAPVDRRLVQAYHGTTQQKAATIIKTRRIPPSTGSGNWLGDGVYFWENSAFRAMQWAHARYKDEAAVVSAELRPGRCLNMFDPEWVPALTRVYHELRDEERAGGAALPRNQGRHHNLDRAVVNRLCERWYKVDTVRAPFREGTRLFPSSMFQGLTHIQLAVRTEATIVHPVRKVYEYGDSLPG